MNKNSGFTAALFTAFLISALTIATLLLLQPNVWDDWKPATCITKGCFCERVREQSPIRQAANTYSSLAFVCSGVLIVTLGCKRDRLPAGYSRLMGISVVIIGVGSAFYHASLTFIGQFFDVLGMFLLAAFMLIYAIERIWTLRFTTSLWLYLSLNLFLGWLQFAIPDTRRYGFAVVIVIALLFEYYYRLKAEPVIQVKWLSFGVGLLVVAYIIWILDNMRIVCFENSLLQGHALWHILGAISVLFLHRYYVSEKN